MNLCRRTNYLRSNLLGTFYRLSTAPTEAAEDSEHGLTDDSDEARAREELIEKKRNVSRLSSAHYNLINGRRPYPVDEPKGVLHMTVKYNRKMYGQYGSESGVNPSLCWPTKQDIQDQVEFESVAHPFTIPQMMDTAAQQKRDVEERILERDRQVIAKFAKLGQWRKEVEDKIAKKAAEAKAAKDKKERLVEEVRRHFGFKLDPRDERFQEMLTIREKEQKKQERLAKKEAKEKQMIAKLQQKNVQIKDGNITVNE